MGHESDVVHRRGRERRPRRIDAAIAALAEGQHGVVARAQLVALGLTDREIDRRIAAGRLHRLHRGVFAVGHRRLNREGRWMASVLAGGPEAVLSHRSAAALWGLFPPVDSAVEVTAPTRRRSRPGLMLHRGVLPLDERTVRDGIPVTTAARTLLDLAAAVARPRLERALNQAEVLRLGDAVSLSDLLDRHPRRRGAAGLRAALADSAWAQVTRSELEVAFLGFLRDARLPPPKTNVLVEGFEVDCAWPGARLIVELDGHATHATRRAFESDRARDRALSAAGWRVVRVTWRQLDGEPASLAADLTRLLAPSPSS